MRDLQINPVWKEQDLGHPIPDSPHACSVALPLWDHVVGYEEGRPDVMDKLHCGYPRFVIHETVRKLIDSCFQDFGKAGQAGLVFPSAGSAERCVEYLARHDHVGATVQDMRSCGVFAVFFPESAREVAELFWRYTGEVISSRQAAAFLSGESGTRDSAGKGARAKRLIRERVAACAGQDESDVFLFPSGMAAVSTLHRMLCHLFPGRKCAQFDFPYVDVLRVQRDWGEGVHFFPHAGKEDFSRLESLVQREPLHGIFCELASNPLLRCPDMDALRILADAHDIPVVADDTIATSVNIDAFRVADVVTTSLTKYFSGSSDVMAGSLVLNRRSPYYGLFSSYLDLHFDDAFWFEDAVVLERNSRDYEERVRRINDSGRCLARYLSRHGKVEAVYYPEFSHKAEYGQLAKDGAGYAGLFSVILRDEAEAAPAFYDCLQVSKGPSLGANFTLACPYTLLAHYPELEWAESCGLSRYLVRVSVGLEEPDDLVRRFEAAFT
jgi:cystathionine gamma-synthase